MAVGVGLLVVVGIGAGLGGYQLGLRASRPVAMTASKSSPAPSATQGPPPSAVPTAASSGNAPSRRSNASWVFDSATGKFLLYGGNSTTGNYNEFPQPLGDAWSWDGATWTPLTSIAPSPRFSSPAVYDDSRKVVLLQGGATGTGADGDTWTFDGTRWIQMGPSRTPPSGSGTSAMAFDSEHGVAVLVFAPMMATGPIAFQTWTWDGSTWKQVATTSQPLGGINQGALAFDPGRKTIIYFGHSINGQSETWVFNGSNWAQVPTNSGTTSQTFAMARDDATSSVLLLGSNGDTWSWDGSKWAPVNPPHSPGPRQGMALGYDALHHVVTLFGGDTGLAASLKHHNDVWTWDGTDWTLVGGG